MGLCLLSAWSRWYFGNYADSVQTAADFLRSQTGPPADVPPGETYYVVASGGWQHLAVPMGLVVLWTAASVWLLGPPETRQNR